MNRLVCLFLLLASNVAHAKTDDNGKELTDFGLLSAIQENHPLEEIRALVTHETATSEALQKAAICKRSDVVRLLLNHEIIPDDTTILACANNCRPNSKNRAEWWLLHSWMHGKKENAKMAAKPKWLQCILEIFND